MTQCFVGVRGTPIDQNQLQDILKQAFGDAADCWHCLRWPDRISPFGQGVPEEFSCQEGQVFSPTRELRWTYSHQDLYDVLLLSTTGAMKGFEPLGDQWEIKDLSAVSGVSEPSRRFGVPAQPQDLELGQRYFMDRISGVVQFVALRVI